MMLLLYEYMEFLMDTQLVLWVVFFLAVIILLFALVRSLWIYRQPTGSKELIRISGYISKGAMAFLTKEYRVLAPFILVVAIVLYCAYFKSQLRYQAFAFIVGGVFSALAGFIGMKVATAANSRTTEAAKKGIGSALKVAFSGGAVMGMSVIGLCLLSLFAVLIVCVNVFGESAQSFNEIILPILAGYSLGASSIALFSRVGGGIYTKAADVGADLVGKVEAGIPEDDPRNPATIADNVGDNVGDVAGMGADLYESFAGSIIGAMMLGVVAKPVGEFYSLGGQDRVQLKLILLPLILMASGAIASLIGILAVRIGKSNNAQKALNRGTFLASALALLFAFPIIWFYIGSIKIEGGIFAGTAGRIPFFFTILLGLFCGSLIGIITEYFTGTGKRPVFSIVKSSETGSATNIITGLGVGMMSTLAPVLLIVATILGSYLLAGLYGVALSAVGMLITLGIELAVDAYGPIADNAGGLAVMAEYPKDVRSITDNLDAVGNTTAAIGKGFAIGSAALTAIILFNSFIEKSLVDSSSAILITNVWVLSGLLIGAMIPFLFSSLAMGAIGRAAFKMIGEVRRQLHEKPAILNGTQEPDYALCVSISTHAALKEMILPGLIAALTPVIVGFTGGVKMLIGLLVGVTVSGVVLAIFMANAGGAWDNAKKMIEMGHSGGKGSDAHKASVVGDTVGDPFKDTAGPAINILIKLMSIVSLVIAPLIS